MEIRIKEIAISRTAIDTGLWHIQRYLIEKYGTAIAERDMYPLQWYVATGRASFDFLRRLFNAKPFMIARKLHQSGTCDDAIQRIKDYLEG